MVIEPRVQIGELGLEQGKLLLLLGHNRQQRHKGVLDEGGRGCPILSGDTVWWW